MSFTIFPQTYRIFRLVTTTICFNQQHSGTHEIFRCVHYRVDRKAIRNVLHVSWFPQFSSPNGVPITKIFILNKAKPDIWTEVAFTPLFQFRLWLTFTPNARSTHFSVRPWRGHFLMYNSANPKNPTVHSPQTLCPWWRGCNQCSKGHTGNVL